MDHTTPEMNPSFTSGKVCFHASLFVHMPVRRFVVYA